MDTEKAEEVEPETCDLEILSREDVLAGFEIIRNFPYDEDEY